ncbi:MFS transporter [Burkholderia sp. D-99]|uniref:MFS transporter n=1 Tax=Burkholderia sp. D-99 TaxID=2717316 RepID=UPI001420B74F|nr:MFS transporter [Burkholderia sp. D-99]NHV25887.1 MFS transporter [Burkholderia sp. D-99]
METGLVSNSIQQQDDEASRADAIYRKVSWRLIPFLFLCYALSFMDRINIGYAQLQMRQDLDINEAIYGLGAGIFFIGYLLFEVPSNLMLERYGARKTIARIMFMWGLVSATMAFVRTPTEFYVVRFLLGVFEAGFFPGVILYLTYWYPSARRSSVVAVLMTSLVVSGVVAGPSSTAIMTGLHDALGFRGWQWMFLLEGLPSSVIAVAAFFYLTDKPADANWLTTDEKAFLIRQVDNDKKLHGEPARSSWAGGVFRNPRIYVLVAINFAVMAGGYSLTFWFPLIVKSFGVKDILHVGLYAVIPNCLGAVAMIGWGRRSDRKLERRWHFACGALVAAGGFFALTFSNGSLVMALISLCVAYMGMAAITPLFWSVPTVMLSRSSAAVGIALISSVSQLGAAFAPWMIGVIKLRTGSFQYGLGVIAVLLVLSAILMIAAIPVHAVRERRAS